MESTDDKKNSKSQWKEQLYDALIDKWIPPIITTTISIIGVIFLAPIIQNDLLNQHDYKRAKSELFKNYSRSFSNYRTDIWYASDTYRKTGTCKLNVKADLKKLVAHGFSLHKFFGEKIQQNNDKMLRHIENTVITCKNAKTVANYLLEQERAIVTPMWSQVYIGY